MTGEEESTTKATTRMTKKARHDTARTEATSRPEEAPGKGEPATIDDSEPMPTEETNGAQSDSDREEADRLDQVLRATVDLMLRRYFRKVESGERETAESELAELLTRARGQFTCVPSPADTTPGPWTPLIANKGQEDEFSYWGRPVYWMWPDPVNWSTANESRSSVGAGGSIAGWWEVAQR